MTDKNDEKIKSLEEEIQHLQEALVKAQEDRVKLRKIADLEAKAAKLREALADTKGGVGSSKNLNISEYVRVNWDTMVKSSFNSEELVIIKEICNDDQGYGNHAYEGYGVDKEGNLVWAYSSGCSCRGTCGTEHKYQAKTFLIDWLDEFTSIDPYTFNFLSVNPVTFGDY
jgi:hypothetical protein